MKPALFTSIVLSIAAIPMQSYAQNWTQTANTQRAKIEQMLRDSLNDPDSLKIDSMTIYKVDLNRYHGCGMLRAKNAYGGYIRQNYVVTGEGTMPVYVGPIPLNVFAKDCTGEIIYSKGP